MPALQLSNEQVFELARQLPAQQRRELLTELSRLEQSLWDDLSADVAEGARVAAAERGVDWDTMSRDERDELIDTLVREVRISNHWNTGPVTGD
jgi:hypothetical protein